MTKIKYDINLMKYMSLFSSITRASVKDVINADKLIFIVDGGQMAKAIGKHGANVKRMSNMLKRDLKIVEFNPDPVAFIKNFIAPIKPTEISNEDGVITITGKTTSEKGILIGRNAANLNKLKEIVDRYFDVKDIVVV